MSKQETLIEKLEKLNDEYLNLYTDLGDKADLCCSGAVDEAINIVKEHSDWVSTDEQLPYAEEMLTNHYNPKEFYEIILKTGELLITSFTHLKNDGNNEIVFMDCTITLIDGEWKLLDDGCDVYEVDDVAYWKQIHPPRGVK
jgi:hypothetical protein